MAKSGEQSEIKHFRTLSITIFARLGSRAPGSRGIKPTIFRTNFISYLWFVGPRCPGKVQSSLLSIEYTRYFREN
jgi:hypothetical protein